VRSFITCTLHQDDRIEEDEMGGLYSTHGRDEI
jgi:hypothetical protein